MQERKTFLSAGWYNLLLFNYAVSPEVLNKYLPKGCELDLNNHSAFLSLVAFQFHNTKVLGIGWPGYTHFPEVNLRFYVKYNGERGVCFVREFVPSRLVSALARLLYNEPYRFADMTDRVEKNLSHLTAEYTVKIGPAKMRFFAKAANKPFKPDPNSVEHFFKEHELGVGTDRSGKTLTYRVHHPVWNIYPIEDYKLEVDAFELYGPEFGFLSQAKPHSVVFAEGSEIQVFQKD